MTRISLLFVLCLALATQAMAQMIAYSDNDLLGQSDQIILGTVVSDTRLPDAEGGNVGQTVITVQQVLKGAKTDQLLATHAVRPVLPPGMMVTDQGGFTLTAGQQQLFFLQRTADGYAIFAGMQGIKPAGDVEKYVKLLADFPYTVTMAPPVQPFSFGQPVSVNITLKNTGATPVNYYNPTLEGQFFALRMGRSVPFNVPPEPLQFRSAPVVPVPPGGSITFTVKIICAKPPSWQLFTPDTYLQTPVMARARVFLRPVTAENARGCYVASPWTTVMIGFPPPQM